MKCDLMVDVADYIDGEIFERICALIPKEKQSEWSPDAFEAEWERIIEEALILYLEKHEE